MKKRAAEPSPHQAASGLRAHEDGIGEIFRKAEGSPQLEAMRPSVPGSARPAAWLRIS